MNDALWPLVNAFHAGQYEACQGLCQRLPPAVIADGQIYLQLALLQTNPLALKDKSTPALKMICLLAQVLYGGDRTVKAQALEAMQAEADQNQSPWVRYLLAEALVYDERIEEALRLVNVHGGDHFECAGLTVRCLLRLNRLDLAQNQVGVLKKMNEESVLTLLSEAALHLSRGDSRVQDAFYIFQELLETYGSQTKLLVNQSVSLLAMHKYAEADKLLQEALQQAPADPQVLANAVVCSLFLQRPKDYIQGLQARLSEAKPLHPLLQELSLKSSLFDRCAARYRSSAVSAAV